MNEQTKNNSLSKIIIILLVLAIAIGGFLVYQNKKRLKEEEAGLFTNLKEDSNVILAEGDKSIADQLKDLQKEVDEGHVSLSMNVTMTVEKDGITGKAYIENPIANRHDMFVTIFLDETQEKIAQTGIIPKGKAIEAIELDEKLEKGTHQATMTYNLIDEDKQVVEQASVGIEIIVK